VTFVLAMNEKISFPQQLRLPMRLFVTSNK